MDECFRCGVSGDKVRLHNAISNKGIVKLCDDCSSIEKLPVIKKPTDNQILESQKQKSVKDRLVGMNRNKLMAGKETSLREIVDRNFKTREFKTYPDLINNFNWTIQRIRRARKITREQFAKAIGEPEATVRMIEQGFLPEDNYKIISKIESYLRVTLRKEGSGFPNTNQPKRFILDNSLTPKEEPPKKFSFNPFATKQLKIEDLRNIKKRKEEMISRQSIEKKEDEEEYSMDDEKFLDEEYFKDGE